MSDTVQQNQKNDTESMFEALRAAQEIFRQNKIVASVNIGVDGINKNGTVHQGSKTLVVGVKGRSPALAPLWRLFGCRNPVKVPAERADRIALMKEVKTLLDTGAPQLPLALVPKDVRFTGAPKA